MREKRHWENQISSLGGPHYRRYGPKMFDAEGREVPGNRGYKYFGAAKDLPGVRELFEQEPPPPTRKTRAELMKDVDADYYGYRDDDDGILIPLEEKAERSTIIHAIEEWKEKQIKGVDEEDEEELYPPEKDVSCMYLFVFFWFSYIFFCCLCRLKHQKMILWECLRQDLLLMYQFPHKKTLRRLFCGNENKNYWKNIVWVKKKYNHNLLSSVTISF